MTTHLFERFKPEYSQWIAVAKIRPEFEHELTIRCQQLLNYKARYAQVSQQTGVPVLWLMPINERESSTNFHTYLGNGDALSRPTRDVPRGRGPFQTWEAGAIDSLRYDHIAGTKDWSPEFMCYEDEVWNGFGYRDRHGIWHARDADEAAATRSVAGGERRGDARASD
jgi:lysozyme family protein